MRWSYGGHFYKRIYEPYGPSDGYRILVDRLWPRGISKEEAKLTDWAKEIAPSSELRKWFGHKAERFDEFQVKYLEELQDDELTRCKFEELCQIAQEKSYITIRCKRSYLQSCPNIKRRNYSKDRMVNRRCNNWYQGNLYEKFE